MLRLHPPRRAGRRDGDRRPRDYQRGHVMTATPESITREELADAMRGLKITPEDENTFYPAVANAIFAAAQRNREPEYEPGDDYEAADGMRWRRTRDGAWMMLAEEGPAPHDPPERPLRKLVPEGSQSAKPSHFDVLAEIVTGLGHDETDKQLADRICKLLEGGTS